jgi:DNA-binding transcriptional LysR family regulator
MDEKLDLDNAVAMMSFAAVVESGSFSAAAEAMGVSKAAVSRQIARLEASVGLKFLDRTTRTIALTPAGRQIYDRCARILDEVNEANQVLSGMTSRPRGELKINAPVVSSLFRVTEVIPDFLKRYPEVRIYLNLSDSKADLLRGRFDVAFWVDEPYDAALEAVKLCEFEMALAASTEYLKRNGRPATAAELKDHQCLIENHLSRPGEWRLSADQIVAVNRSPLTSNSVRVTREAMLADMGVAYLPRFLIEEDLAAGRLELLLPHIVSYSLPLYVMFPKGHYMLSKVKAFVDFLRVEIGRSDIAAPPTRRPADQAGTAPAGD